MTVMSDRYQNKYHPQEGNYHLLSIIDHLLKSQLIITHIIKYNSMSEKRSSRYLIGLMRDDYEEEWQRIMGESVFGKLDTQDLRQSFIFDIQHRNIPGGQQIPLKKDSKRQAQNQSSCGVTIVAKILSNDINMQARNEVRARFKLFLEEKGMVNSQIFSVFAYLFFVKNKALPEMFISFNKDMLEYYKTRQNGEADENEKTALKYQAKTKLLNYLFSFLGEEVDFKEIRKLSQPLYTGNQESQLDKILDKARVAYKQILEEL